ncbi:peptidoglycan bridge formation glycyltransferase FemA/FemB family protein [Candidatus Saccharibacteria bacterium]|nr:peptidoglycan bridge formation glycyltransferase FemA/FemB family protein [Candidatus Saccharibacteria bacterium]
MEIPITQSKEWLVLQQDLKEKSVYVDEKDYKYLAIIKSTPVGNYLYLPYGPVYKDEIAFQKALDSLKQIAATHQAIFIRIEPRDKNFTEYLPKNTKKTKDLNPKETWVLDLKGTDEQLTKKLPSRLLRYYKGAAKKGITIEKSNNPDDIIHLLRLQQELAKEKGISTFSENYLKTELSQPFATLYLVKYKNEEMDRQEIVAAGLVFDDKTTRYNLQGAQNDTGRSLHATGILTIQLIKDAKEKGLKTFDFWGIAPEGAPRSHPWAGFTNFKKTFDGYEKDYAGTYDVIMSLIRYHLYTFFRRLNKIKRNNHARN